tara:strand:- start:58 stop:621 length:564 start_codon:yes stop_codon:yes gene_type:complete
MYKNINAIVNILILTIKKNIVKILLGIRVYKKYGLVLQHGNIIDSLENIKIGKNFNFSEQSKVLARGENASIIILDDVTFNYNVMVNADLGGNIFIGNNVIIGPNTVFRASDHKIKLGINYNKSGHLPGNISIQDNVWIGSNVVITKDVTVGSNSVIGAGSVVTKDVLPNSIYAGVPAKKIMEISDK